MIGPQNGSSIKVLTRITFADSSRFEFDYTSWGQVWKVSNFASDGHLLNYRSYNLPLNNSTAQTDCPRFTQRRDWAENWNRSGPLGPASLPVGSEQEVVTQFIEPVTESWTMPDSTQQTGTRAQVTLPDNTSHKIYFAGTAGTSSGWQRGLVSLVETVSGGTWQRKSATTWAQDNTTVSYPLNPRVTETNTYDPAGNRARTRVTYQGVSFADGTSCNLPQDVYEYQANATTILRRTHTAYNLATTYTDRRIIGLVSEKTLYEVDPNTQAETLMSKVGFHYDNDEASSIQGNDAPVQHDNTNYTASFVTGRANLSSVKRYDVVTSQFVTSSSKYNTAGSVVQTTDPANHQVSVSYTDAFSADGTNLDAPRPFVTLAYPTTVTDADGYSSSVRYHYDFGAATWKQTPQPNTIIANTPGPEQKLNYDNSGRLQQVTNLANSAYTRFIYGPNYVESWASVNNAADEAHSLQVFDGAGRVIAKAGNHPDSAGGFGGQLVLYDAMGRPIKQSNSTETSISISGAPIHPYNWQATGDDASAGWLYTQQTYDWKGRPLVTTNTDLTTKEASYGGCGCAGGEVVTLTDEGTVDGGVPKRRQQKVFSDVLGRTVKTEILNWQGGGVYATTVNTYNARDQVRLVRQFSGTAPSDPNDLSCPTGTCQQATMTYDGHGRLETRHVPEQNAGTATTWDYNDDDTILAVADARGASQTFGYNNRHLVTGITYASPGGSGITVPAPVSFGFDAAGNRISMTDGLGSAAYGYNQLSQMTSESRTFTGLGTFNLSYGYNLAAQLTSITDHFGAQVGYVHDTAGRVMTVTSANFGSVPSYASNIKYRAFGALKSLDYGNSRSLSMTYNTRLQPATFSVPGVMSKTYDYQADGRVKFSQDLLNAQFDRSYAHDHAGRITEALSGAEARNEGPTNSRPYKESFVYDAFGHLTQRPVNKVWSGQGGTFSPTQQTYVNERNTVWEYDADGNLTNSGSVDYTIDAAGRASRVVSVTAFPPDGQPIGDDAYGTMMDLTQSFDGDGLAVKKLAVETLLYPDPEENVTTTKTFHLLRSSVLGGKVVSEFGTESDQRGFVYLGGAVLALQYRTTQTVNWQHRDAGNASHRLTSSNGTVLNDGNGELDPLGGEAGTTNTVTPPSPRLWKLTVYPGFGNSGMDGAGQCTRDYMPTPCSEVFRAVNNGSAEQCPNNDCDPVPVVYQGQDTWAHFNAYADGYQGYVPGGATYIGNGNFRAQGSGPPSLRNHPSRETNFSTLNGATGEAQLGRPQKSGVEFLPKPIGGSYGERGQAQIKSIIDSLLQNERCRRAFEILGLQTVNQTVEKGLVIGPATLLNNPANNGMMGITEGARRAYSDEFSKGAQAGTIMNIPGQPNPFASRRDQRPRMFFATSAFNEGASGLREFIIHEFIHAGGQPPISSWFGHDLSNYEWYDFLQESCR